MLDALPGISFGSLLRLEYFSDSDHTFSSERNRTRMMDLVLGWIDSSKFPPAGRAAPPAE